VKCIVWNIASYGAETWTLRKVKTLKVLQCGFEERLEKISCTGRMKNEEVLRRDEEERNIRRTVRRRKANWTVHTLRMNCLLKYIIEGRM
jgi:hypothetical protein